MSKNVIIVDEIDRNNVQRADLECSARMNIISFLIKNNVEISNTRFQDYQNEYTKYFAEFETQKVNLERKYLAGKSYTSWALNYQTCELTYEY
jgi:hypothetical protein